MNKGEERRERMESALADWLESGEPLTAFARRSGYSVGQLRYWMRRLGEAPGAAPVEVPAVSFQPVRLVDEDDRANDPQVEVVLATGDRVVIRGAITPAIVSTILAELRARC